MKYILDEKEYQEIENRLAKLRKKNKRMKKRLGIVKPKGEEAAKKQFGRLGYKQFPMIIPVIRYERAEDDCGKLISYIEFCMISKSVSKYQRRHLGASAEERPGYITVKESEAINKQIQELGW